MILPEPMHRHWNVLEPSILSISGGAGGALAILLAPEASTPAEYGALFIGFLIFLGMGVLGIAGFTATYIAKAMVKAIGDIGGDQAEKVFHLQTQEQFDKRFEAIEQASVDRIEKVVGALDSAGKSMAALERSVGLLSQEIKHQVTRGDELRESIKKDVETLQAHVFGNHQFDRRSTDQS
jgi:hypothetical protein